MLFGGSGVGAGWRTVTLYAGVSGRSGCWMTGAERLSADCGTSENLSETKLSISSGEMMNGTDFLPRMLRKPVMVFCAFLTSWCLAWLPMYCDYQAISMLLWKNRT